MPEYSKYIPSESIDWLSLAKDVKTDIDQGLRIREERKVADESLLTDATAKINEWQSTQSKPFNEVVFNGLDKAKQKALDWNRQLKSGEITRAEYQRRINNLNDSFNSFSVATKNFDQYVVGVNQMMKDDKASSHMIFSAQLNSDLMDLGNKQLAVGDNGDFFVVGTDGAVQNVRNYTNMNNVSDVKINVPESVSKVVKDWQPWLIEDLMKSGAVVSDEDVRLNKDYYTKAKADLIGSIVDTNNPRAVVSVLLDNSNFNYQEYYTEKQKINLIQKAISNKQLADGKEMSNEEKAAFADKYSRENLIQVVQDNDGNYQPIINDKMIKDAQSVVADNIEIMLASKRKEERGFAPSGGGGGGGGGTKEDAPTKAGWELSLGAMNSVPIGATSSNDTSGVLTQLGAKNPNLLFKKVKWKNGKTGIAVFKQNKDGDWITDKNILNPRDLAPYIYGTSNVDKALTMWDEANKTYGGSQSNNQTKYNIKGKTYTFEQLKAMGYDASQVEPYKIK